MTVDIADFATPDPERPPVPITVDWAAVEQWLGLRLPTDYKRLISTHGPLDFGEYLWIHGPCAQGDQFDFGSWAASVHRSARIDARMQPEHEQPVIHPRPGGLLAWGRSRRSDILFWDTSTSADPDDWTVVVRHIHRPPGSGLRAWHPYDLTLTGYLRHTVRTAADAPAPHGPMIGPLPGTMARTAFLATAGPWDPPPATAPRLTAEQRRVALETGSGLEALRLLSPPPARPYLGDGDWADLHAELGTRLPQEYLTLMELYGSGCWSNWLRFHTPLRTDDKRRFLRHVEYVAEAYGSLGEDDPEQYPLAMWPEPGGFLPFANSIDGDHLGWLTEGADPDAWPLVVWPRHAPQGPPLETGLIDTLVAWQRGHLEADGFAELDQDDDPVEFASFAPWDDHAYW
ncbi:SMI1/KNR4 family protein [Streptacidiphilus griseoplanus]|uniref:SMI1/KNR4 family protein n=1 Tax=Peterkaempfera griseoplana TaxID=66896 RepID=UPI0006E38E94|nr:SMI1/KNR4 family protein [Peterkaempfera griseoplana]